MAKPDTDDGWIPYAHELDAALAVADFSKGARIVLREVFSQIFGFTGKGGHRTATLSPVDIARRSGQAKEHVVRAISHLVRCGVLRRVDRGRYAFVKDYESWLDVDGGRRLTAVEIAWCCSASRMAMAHKRVDDSVRKAGAQTDPKAPDVGAQTDPSWGRKALPNGGANCSQLGAQIDPDGSCATNRNGRVEFKTEELKLTHRESASDNDSVEEPEPFQAPLEATPIPNAGPGMDSPAALALETWAKQLGVDRDMESYAHWARQTCDYAPADWIRAALTHQVLGRSGAKRASIPYLASILKKWLASGECPHLKAASRPASESEYAKAPPDYADHIAGKRKGNA